MLQPFSVAGWSHKAIDNLPSSEDDRHEYKSGKTPLARLDGVLQKAASAFWNSGGGILVIGVDGSAMPDHGIPPLIGSQPLRDWIDQALHRVDPTGPYDIALIPTEEFESPVLQAGTVVIAVGFGESHQIPHMVPDGRIYIRAGAHSVPARMFIVEALMARRGLRQPVLRATFRLRPGTSQSLQIAVIPLSDAPALDVELTLDPIPAMWAKAENPFPLQIPVIDRAVPFFMDLSTWTLANERVGPDVTLYLKYRDLAGNRYEHQQLLNVGKGIEPWHVGAPPLEKVARELEDLTKAIERLALRQDRSR